MNHWRAAAVIAALVALALGPTNAVAEPTASFTFTPAIPLAGDTVSLDGSQAADPTHDNYFYAWDFDDGTGDEGAQVTHVFDEPGTYRVMLEVTDENGDSATTTRDVHVAQRPDESARAGGVDAEWYYGSAARGYQPMRLKISRGGSTVFTRNIRPICTGCSTVPLYSYQARRSIRVLDLDGDGEPEVVLALSNGGNICCTYSTVFRFVESSGTYEKATHVWIDSGPGPLTDLDGDGRPEWKSSDGRIRYEFGCGGCVPYPIHIVGYASGRFVDVTRRFRGLVRADAARNLRLFRKHRAYSEEGALAAWTADQYLLGHKARAWRFVRKALRRGHLRRRGEFDLYPTDAGYIRALRRWLQRNRYG